MENTSHTSRDSRGLCTYIANLSIMGFVFVATVVGASSPSEEKSVIRLEPDWIAEDVCLLAVVEISVVFTISKRVS